MSARCLPLPLEFDARSAAAFPAKSLHDYKFWPHAAPRGQRLWRSQPGLLVRGDGELPELNHGGTESPPRVGYSFALSINRVLSKKTARAIWVPCPTVETGSSVRGSKNSR